MRRSGIGLLVMGTSLAVLGAARAETTKGRPTTPGHREAGHEERRPADRAGRLALGNPLRVLITRDGEPVEGVDVDWSAGQGGSFSDWKRRATRTGSRLWCGRSVLKIGNHAATAAIDGADGSPLTYTATATSGTEPPPGPTVQVLGPDGGNRFEPAVVTITVGQTVTWEWPAGCIAHNVVPDDGNNPIPQRTDHGRTRNVLVHLQLRRDVPVLLPDPWRRSAGSGWLDGSSSIQASSRAMAKRPVISGRNST